MTDFMFRKNLLITFAAFLLLFIVWKVLSVLMDSVIILPSPEQTISEAFRLMRTANFWHALAATLVRGFTGFALSFILGLVIGFPAGKYALFMQFIKPYILIIRSTPVLAIILIALIWFPADGVPVFVTVLMAFPVILQNVATGIQGTDIKLIEMAKVYRVGRRRLLFNLYLPSLLPYLRSGASSAMGLAWRVVIAAEILSQPLWGIGTGMQEARIRLETPRVFAWTLAALALSWLSDTAFSRLFPQDSHTKRRAAGSGSF